MACGLLLRRAMQLPSPPATDPGTDDLRALLAREQASVDILLENVADALEAGQATWCASCFGELDRHIEAHMRLEEEQIFPELEQSVPREVAMLRDEHRRIRARLAAIPAGLALGPTHAAAIRSLVAQLREHEARESTVAYRWAEANLDGATHAKLKQRVRERIASLLERVRTRWI